jgi:FkbM family methyltransferase
MHSEQTSRLNVRSLIRRGIERLPFGLLYEVFYQSGRALGIKSYEVSGSAGSFIGPFNDQSVIKQYLRNGHLSAVIVNLFRDFFDARGGGSFYDLGANIGMVTVPIARNAGVNCVCFEPDPVNFALLRANILLNGPHANIETVNAAVAREPGELRFARSDYNCGDHRLSEDGSLVVRAVRLDDYMPKALPLAVKIDCQGAEPSIVAGGTQTLAIADLIVCEFWPWGMRRMGLSPAPILEFATRHFPFAQVLHHDQPPTRPLPVAEAVRVLQTLIDDGGEFAQADLVLTREQM